MPETVPLDPDLFQIAEGQPANIIQWVYRIQAERDKDRARFEPSFDDADFEEEEHPRNKGGKFTSKGGEGSGGKTQHQKNAEVLEEHHAKSTTEKPPSGMPEGKLPHEVERLMERPDGFDFHVTTGEPGRYEIVVTAPAPSGIKQIGEGRLINQYDPKYAEVKVLNANNPIIRREIAVLKEEVSEKLPIQRDDSLMYRGMSHEEYKSFVDNEYIKSTGGYNLGSEQEGLTYWSADPEQARFYANSFQPAQYKATFEKPAYVLVAKRPNESDIKHVKGTGEEEIGVNRAVGKDEIVEVWRGKVAIFNAGSLSIRRSFYKKELEFSGGVMPSSQVIWEKVSGLTEDKYNPGESRDPEGKWTEGGGSGKAPAKSAKSSVKPVTLEKSKERAWGGKPTDASRLDKQHAGELGEEIAVAFVKKVLGFKDAKRLNVKIGNLAVDMIGDHHLYEIKTGQVTNSVAAAQWRATIGQPGKAEAELLKSMSPEEKARYNQGKAARIMERKQKQVQEWSKELGRDVHPKTITLVIDPDKQIADVHYFDGFHHRIGYNSNAAKSAYMGSFRYSSAEGSPRRSRSDDRRVFSGFKDRGFQTLWQNRRFTLRLS